MHFTQTAVKPAAVIAVRVFGLNYGKGAGVALDLNLANMFFDKACNSGSGRGCVRLGFSTLTGRRMSSDASRANEIFGKACNLGYGDGCDNLGVNFENANGVPRDLVQANTFYNKACELGSRAGCLT